MRPSGVRKNSSGDVWRIWLAMNGAVIVTNRITTKMPSATILRRSATNRCSELRRKLRAGPRVALPLGATARDAICAAGEAGLALAASAGEVMAGYFRRRRSRVAHPWIDQSVANVGEQRAEDR